MWTFTHVKFFHSYKEVPQLLKEENNLEDLSEGLKRNVRAVIHKH